jgi:DNA-binding response OmpR family regulator
MRVLLIEDDEAIAEEIKEGLEEEHFRVDVAANGPAGLALAEAEEGRYAVILLDIMLPGIDGWEVCRRLRARRDRTSILMLTARDAPPDRVRGLDLGADDYLPKPFDFGELVARVRALQRRDRIHRTRLIRIADLEIDTGAHRVFRGGQELSLTDREFTLLEALASRQGHALSREFIQQRVWGDDEVLSNTVDAWVHLLRKKIDAGRSVKLIQTVHGIGYALRDDAPAAAAAPSAAAGDESPAGGS